ncbi:MAG: hypothetical protein ACN6O7_04315 [Sphingobacterium sp.]
MRSTVYDPKALLLTLIDTEKHLNLEIEKHFSNEGFSIADDLDQAFADFFGSRDLKGNEVGYLSSQLTLLQLKREVRKAIDVVVDSNQLRAYYDYVNLNDAHLQMKSSTGQQKSPKISFWWAVVAGVLILLAILLLTI